MTDLLLLAKALSDPTRVRILYALTQDHLCVCELSDAMEMSVSTLSTHLQVIRQAGIVETSRRHKFIEYALTEEAKQTLVCLFDTYRDELEADHRIRRDTERIRLRLALREGGHCVCGPGLLEASSKAGGA